MEEPERRDIELVQLRQAVQWVVDHLDDFNPLSDGQPTSVGSAQRISELAISVYCWISLSGGRVDERVARMVAFLERVQAEEEIFHRLLRSPAGLSLLCYPYAVLRLLRRDDPSQREVLQRLIDSGWLDQNERLPYRTMDIRLSVEWAELHHELPQWETLYEASILAQQLHVPYVESSAAYALTHALLFSVGFGTRPPPPHLLFSASRLRPILSMLLVSFCQERHWDLVGELLCCWECLELGQDFIVAQSWASFLKQQKPNGSFPGPRTQESDQTLNGEASSASSGFSHHYHTTLVAVLALSRRQLRPAHTTLGDQSVDREREQGENLHHPRPASPSHLRDAVERADRWLDSELIRLEGNTAASTRPDTLCRLLVCRWICSQYTGGTDNPRFTTIADQLNGCNWSAEEWARVPAGLKLIAAALVSSARKPVPALAQYFGTALDALRAAPPSDAESDLALCESRILVHALGLHPEPPGLAVSNVLQHLRSIDLSNRALTEDLLLRVNSCTAYGLRAVEPPVEMSNLCRLLQALALHSLRVYDLPAACRAIRALCHLGPIARRGTQECAGYLLLQQLPSGPFGFYGPEIADLTRDTEGIVPVADLYLPVMLECLWALAEVLDESWSLYRAVAVASRNSFPPNGSLSRGPER